MACTWMNAAYYMAWTTVGWQLANLLQSHEVMVAPSTETGTQSLHLACEPSPKVQGNRPEIFPSPGAPGRLGGRRAGRFRALGAYHGLQAAEDGLSGLVNVNGGQLHHCGTPQVPPQRLGVDIGGSVGCGGVRGRLEDHTPPAVGGPGHPHHGALSPRWVCNAPPRCCILVWSGRPRPGIWPCGPPIVAGWRAGASHVGRETRAPMRGGDQAGSPALWRYPGRLATHRTR